MKKTFLKLTSALTAFCLIFGTVASAAAVQSGGTETDYNYYWCQDFNDLPVGTQKSGGFARWWGGTVGRYTVRGNKRLCHKIYIIRKWSYAY